MASGKKDYNIDFVLCQPPLCEKTAFLCGISLSYPFAKFAERQLRANREAADDLPLAGLAFERRQWRMQRERQAAAVRKCKANAAARAVNGKGGSVARCQPRRWLTEREKHSLYPKQSHL